MDGGFLGTETDNMGTTKNDMCKTEVRDINVERPSLVGTAGEFEGQIIELPERIRLGRHPQNDLCFSDPTVSAFHAQITAVGDRYEIMDLRSKNRLKLNGKRIHRPVFLANNDLFEIGKNSFRFRLLRSGGTADTPSTSDRNTISKPEVGLQSSDGIIHTQKTRGCSATGSKRTSVRDDLEGHAVKVAAQGAGEPEGKMNRKKPKRAGRVVANVALRGLAAFIVCLIVAWPIVARFVLNTSPTAPKQNAVSEYKSLWDYRVRLALIQRIWKKWESELSEKEPDVGDIDSFLDRTLRQAAQMQISAPAVQWRFYKTCLRITRATKGEPEDSEYRKQAEQLLLRVKIEIEDEEKRYSILLQEAKEAGERSNAIEILQHIKDLLDLKHDNREGELAQAYCDLEQEIKQEQDSHAGS